MKPGARISKRYEVLRQLGRGAMGEVFLCLDHQLGREVALKWVRPKWAAKDDVTRRFLREARIMASLEHPHLVQVYDIDEHGGAAYVVLEYVEGYDLARRLEKRGRLGPTTVVRLAAEVGGALDALHAVGVNHRDVKPANILVRRRDRSFVLMDLGLASDRNASSLTRSGQLIGTPRYMPPELIQGQRSTPASDVFQLGVVLFEAMTGVHMIPGDNLAELGKALRRGAWAEFPEDLERVPSAARAALRRAVDPNPAKRPATCAHLVEELSAGMGVTSRVVTGPLRGRATARPPRRGYGGLLLGPLVALSAAAVGYGLAKRQAEPKDVRWGVVGDALVVDFRAPNSLPVRMFVDNLSVAAREEAGQGPLGRRLIYRGLSPGVEVRAWLVWAGGQEPAAGFQGDRLAVGRDLELAARGGISLALRRPITARWIGDPKERVHRLASGRAWMPAPPDLTKPWQLEWEEAGVRFSRAWDPLKVYEGYIEEMSRRLVTAAQGAADPTTALRRAWAEGASWMPAVLTSALPANRRRHLLRVRELAEVRATGSNWTPVPADFPGGRSASETGPRGEGRVQVRLTEGTPLASGSEGFVLFTNAVAAFDRQEFNVPVPVRLQWPEIPAEVKLVSLWFEVSDLPPTGQLRFQGKAAGGPFVLHAFAPPEKLGLRRYQGWLRIVLPADLLPAAESPAEIALKYRGPERPSAFLQTGLHSVWVSW